MKTGGSKKGGGMTLQDAIHIQMKPEDHFPSAVEEARQIVLRFAIHELLGKLDEVAG